MAAVAAEVFSSPQPALLYLVPCTLIPFVIKATIQVPDTPTCISGIYESVYMSPLSNNMVVLFYRDPGDGSERHPKCHLFNHPKDILHNKTHLYRILVHLTLSSSWILNFFKLPKLKILSASLIVLLIDNSCKARDQTKQQTVIFYDQTHLGCAF